MHAYSLLYARYNMTYSQEIEEGCICGLLWKQDLHKVMLRLSS